MGKKKKSKKHTNNKAERWTEEQAEEYLKGIYGMELSGYPLVRFDFFLLEILNITGSTLYKHSKVNNVKIKEIIRELYIYSKEFYEECLTCENNCLKDPLKGLVLNH